MPSLGVPDVPWLVFLVYVEEVLTDLVRELSVTCAEVDVCLLPQKSIAGGTDGSTSIRDVTPSALLSLPLECQDLSWLKVQLMLHMNIVGGI